MKGGYDGGVIRLEVEGVHGHEGQVRRDRALKAQQAPAAPLEGQQEEALLLLEPEQPAGEMELLLLAALHLTEILCLHQHVLSSLLPHTFSLPSKKEYQKENSETILL